MPPRSTVGSHYIVCGDSPLAYRIARELTRRYGANVVVVLADKLRNHGPRIAALPRVTVREHSLLTGEAFLDADIASARALALVGLDDLDNFHAAMRARELNPTLQLVVAAYSPHLNKRIADFLTDCTVLSRSELAAPALVAAALGEIAPSLVTLSGKTLYVAKHSDHAAGQVLCGFIVPAEPDGAIQMVAPQELNGTADYILAVADGERRDPLRRRRHPVRGALRVARQLLWNKFGLTFGILLAVMVAGFALLIFAKSIPSNVSYTPGNVLYLGVMDMTGSALTAPADSWQEKVAQVLLTGAGMALLPLITAIIVGARLTGTVRGEPRPRGGHVIVVGGGDIGARVIEELHELNFDVALIDQDPAARAVAFTRSKGMSVIIGDAPDELTLRRADVDNAIAIVLATSSDIVNLETALQARSLRGEDLRVVLRLFDGDLAHRVSKNLGANVHSYSMSYLAAPAFAVAMLEHHVHRTIAVDRHVLVIADIRIVPGSGLADRLLRDLEQDRLSRVLAIAPAGKADNLDWMPRHDRRLMADERLIILATRAGLSAFVTANRPPAVTV